MTPVEQYRQMQKEWRWLWRLWSVAEQDNHIARMVAYAREHGLDTNSEGMEIPTRNIEPKV